MKKLLIFGLILLFATNVYAGTISRPTTYTTNGTVTAVNLNNNFDTVYNVVNSNLDNANANTTDGFRFYEVLGSNPSAGTEGRFVYNTVDNWFYADNGAAYVAQVDVSSTQTVSGVKTFSGANTHSGATTVSGTLTATGNVSLSGGDFVFNEGSVDKNFRCESNGEVNMFFIDGGADAIGMGTATPTTGSGAGGIYAVMEDTGVSTSFSFDRTDVSGTSGIGSITFERSDDVLASITGAAAGATDAGQLIFSTQATGGAATVKMIISSTGAIGSSDGISIGGAAAVYTANAHIDDSSHGGDSITLYIGDETITTSGFTGCHYYQLGDTNLKAGELVKLVNGKIYRSDTKQDPTAIGLFKGVTRWSDSMGNEYIVSDDKDINKPVKKSDKKKGAETSDYAYSVAISGDSYEEHDTYPLEGGYVTIDAGTIKTGDLLCSSNKAGYLEKQVDDLIHSYTVGKAMQDITKDCKDAYVYLLQ